MLLRNIFLFSAIFLFVKSVSAQEVFERAEVSYISWNKQVRARLRPDDVRNNADISMTIRGGGEILNLVRLLDIASMRNIDEEERVGDIRLVIDLYQDGKRTTYAASRFLLFADGAIKGRNIDEAFKSKFSFAPVPTVSTP